MKVKDAATQGLQGAILILATLQGCRQAGISGIRVKQLMVALPATHIGLSALTGQTTPDPWLLPRDSIKKTTMLAGGVVGLVGIMHLISIPFHHLVRKWQGVLPKQNAVAYLEWAYRAGGAIRTRALLDICVLGPIGEEVLFRGFIQQNIEKIQRTVSEEEADSIRGHVMRIGFTSILFGLWHYSAQQGWTNALLVPITTTMGVMFGYMAEHGGLLPSIATHAAQNAGVTARILLL